MNTIIYEQHCDFFTFARAGVDEKLNPIDPYNRIKDYRGFHIYATGSDELNNILNFLGMSLEQLRSLANNPLRKTIACEGRFKIVFNAYGQPILYHAEDKDPKRVSKICKTECKFFKEWAEPFSGLYGTPREIKGWKFDKGVKYVRTRRYHLIDLYNLVPELFGIDVYEFIKKEFYQNYDSAAAYKKACEYLYNLDPIDLSQPFDYTPEEKAILAERKRVKEEEKRKAAEELERRKNTAGYCNECGAEHAEYIPFIGRYLCSECFHNLIHGDDW